MLVPKEHYKNMELTFRVGVATFTINTNDITDNKIEAFKNHIDLSHYVELEEEESIEHLVDLQDTLSRIEEETEAPKPTTIKKKRQTRKK